MSKEIEWEDPTASSHGKAREFAAELAKRPGKWALYSTVKNQNTAGSVANYLKRVYGLDVTTRGKKIYARWIDKEAAR